MLRMQDLMRTWSYYVFNGHMEKLTPKVRAMRVLEEALELAQAERVTVEEASIIQKQVYDKPAGDPQSELGGVMTTVIAYAEIAGYSAEDAFWTEFQRIMDPKMMEKVRNRNLSGDKIGMQ